MLNVVRSCVILLFVFVLRRLFCGLLDEMIGTECTVWYIPYDLCGVPAPAAVAGGTSSIPPEDERHNRTYCHSLVRYVHPELAMHPLQSTATLSGTPRPQEPMDRSDLLITNAGILKALQYWMTGRKPVAEKQPFDTCFKS
eukprot:GHVT01011429.1.p1 GENE.GHVT01011429.1~~GHVT01011429.1.p1  ORF type:complete len:141 (+),score=5.54 GHVT01011429.1:290-712(+)